MWSQRGNAADRLPARGYEGMWEATISESELTRYREFHLRIYHRMISLINTGDLVVVRDVQECSV